MDGQPPPTTLATTQDGYAYLIAAAIDKGMTVESMGKLLELEEKYKAGKAREAFNRDMNIAQSMMPVVAKTRTNSHTKSRYAELSAVIETIRPIYTAQGFSLSFGTEKCDLPNHIRLTCDVFHKDGHTKRYAGDFALDGVGSAGNANKTMIQATGSTISYGRRYLTLMIFNVAVADDTDGNDENRTITPDQIGEINDLIGKCDQAGKPVNYAGFLTWLSISSLEDLPMTQFGKAIYHLTQKLEATKKR